MSEKGQHLHASYATSGGTAVVSAAMREGLAGPSLREEEERGQ
ncbi:hypothetical protein N9L68_08270 [bacterium]|nr:hypothetical protein [bacterium]